MDDCKKLSGKELVETIKDTIYDVLEEELDFRLKQMLKAKSLKEKFERVKKIKAIKKLKEAKEKLVAIKVKKDKLKKAYNRLSHEEKQLSKK